MDLATGVLSGFGLSAAAGLNAYIPLFIVGLLIRSDQIQVSAPYDILGQTPVLIVLGVLLFVETVVDKIPGLDHANDVLMSILRPTAGALLFAGSVGTVTSQKPWVGFAAGLVTAGSVHATKATARIGITGATFGTGGWAASILEDLASFLTTVLAIFIPVIGFVAAIAIAVFGVRAYRRRKSRKATENRVADASPENAPPRSAPDQEDPEVVQA
jgi:hypothetical protein